MQFPSPWLSEIEKPFSLIFVLKFSESPVSSLACCSICRRRLKMCLSGSSVNGKNNIKTLEASIAIENTVMLENIKNMAMTPAYARPHVRRDSNGGVREESPRPGAFVCLDQSQPFKRQPKELLG